MESWIQTIVSVLLTLIASSGFWTFLFKRSDSKSAKTQMIIGLGHDRIMSLGKFYIERGYITPDEYENLYDYLYKPYEMMGGNGSAKLIMSKVQQLPMQDAGGEDNGKKKA